VPFTENSWYDKKKMKVGYEIAFNKYFYKYEALRPLSEIAADILALNNETENLLKDIVE
jgi:type I restriction enzyme M protein